MGEPDLVPRGERILSSGWHGDEIDGEVVTTLVGDCPVLSDRTISVSDISTVLSNKYLTSDSCGVAQSDRTSSVSDISTVLSGKYLTQSDICGVAQSDRTSSVSDISTVLSNKYLTHDSCGVAQSDYGTMDELCQMRGTDEYECRVERVPGPAHQGKVLDGPAYSVRRYYRIVIVLLYVGQYYAHYGYHNNTYFQA
jgi:hypothetical protein